MRDSSIGSKTVELQGVGWVPCLHCTTAWWHVREYAYWFTLHYTGHMSCESTFWFTLHYTGHMSCESTYRFTLHYCMVTCSSINLLVYIALLHGHMSCESTYWFTLHYCMVACSWINLLVYISLLATLVVNQLIGMHCTAGGVLMNQLNLLLSLIIWSWPSCQTELVSDHLRLTFTRGRAMHLLLICIFLSKCSAKNTFQTSNNLYFFTWSISSLSLPWQDVATIVIYEFRQTLFLRIRTDEWFSNVHCALYFYAYIHNAGYIVWTSYNHPEQRFWSKLVTLINSFQLKLR